MSLYDDLAPGDFAVVAPAFTPLPAHPDQWLVVRVEELFRDNRAFRASHVEAGRMVEKMYAQGHLICVASPKDCHAYRRMCRQRMATPTLTAAERDETLRGIWAVPDAPRRREDAA